MVEHSVCGERQGQGYSGGSRVYGEHREASELTAPSHLPANGTEWQGPSRMGAGCLPCPGMLDEASRLVEAETSLETAPKERCP